MRPKKYNFFEIKKNKENNTIYLNSSNTEIMDYKQVEKLKSAFIMKNKVPSGFFWALKGIICFTPKEYYEFERIFHKHKQEILKVNDWNLVLRFLSLLERVDIIDDTKEILNYLKKHKISEEFLSEHYSNLSKTLKKIKSDPGNDELSLRIRKLIREGRI